MALSGRPSPSGRTAALALTALACLALAACGGGTSVGVAPLVSGAYATFQPAGVVIGQPGFSENSPNQGNGSQPYAETLRQPAGNSLPFGGTLYVPDTGNNRVLGYSGVPAVNNQVATFAVGQPDLQSATAPAQPTSSSLNAPRGLATYGGDLVVADSGNNRVLIWSQAPTGSSPADVVLGQHGNFQTGSAACGWPGLNDPAGVAVTPGGKLVVVDTGNNRILIWDQVPTTNPPPPPSLILGQPTISATTCPVNQGQSSSAANTLDTPTAVWTDGTRLVVADSGNNRVLIWTSFPTREDQPADRVLGQGDFAHDAANDDAQNGTQQPTPTARTLYDPRGVYSDGTRLFVADTGNNRVLIWNAFPSASFAPADVVLGQGDFTHNTQNDDNQDGQQDASASARTLYAPGGVTETGKKLLVSDSSNNRVLVYQGQ